MWPPSRNAFSDYNLAQNPSGRWAYGRSDSGALQVTSFRLNGLQRTDWMQLWGMPSGNFGAIAATDQLPLALHPECRSGQTSVLRFEVPSAATLRRFASALSLPSPRTGQTEAGGETHDVNEEVSTTTSSSSVDAVAKGAFSSRTIESCLATSAMTQSRCLRFQTARRRRTASASCSGSTIAAGQSRRTCTFRWDSRETVIARKARLALT